MEETLELPFQLDLGGVSEELQVFDPDQLVPWPGLNPRQHFDPDKLRDIAASIKENGVLQNIVVHETGTFPKWIVAGETRWRAAKEAGARLPARVRLFTEAQAHRIAILENMQRNDLTPVEEGRAFSRQLELEPALTQEVLAKQLGKDQSYVSDRVRLLELPEYLQELVDQRIITPTHARDHLFPIRKSQAADEIFDTLFTMIGARPNPAEIVPGSWLAEHVALLVKMCKAADATSDTEPAKPAPRAPAKKSAPAKPTTTVRKGVAVTGVPSAQPASAPDGELALEQQEDAGDDDDANDAANDVDAADANDVPNDVSPDVASETGDTSSNADVEDAPADDVETLPQAPPAPTLIGYLEPLLDAFSISVVFVKVGDRGIAATVTPTRKRGRGAITPLVLTGTSAELHETMPAAVHEYATDLLTQQPEADAA